MNLDSNTKNTSSQKNGIIKTKKLQNTGKYPKKYTKAHYFHIRRTGNFSQGQKNNPSRLNSQPDKRKIWCAKT